MKLAIHAQQIDAPRDVVAYLAKHLLRPLQRLHDSTATQLTVHIQDAKPGKGGAVQACKLTFRMPGSRTLRVESVRDDLHAALLESAQRLRRLVQREIQKSRSPSRALQDKPLGKTWRAAASRSATAPDGSPSTL